MAIDAIGLAELPVCPELWLALATPSSGKSMHPDVTLLPPLLMLCQPQLLSITLLTVM